MDLSVPHPQEARWERYKQKKKLKDGDARKRKFDNVPGSFNDMPNWGGTRDHSVRWRG